MPHSGSDPQAAAGNVPAYLRYTAEHAWARLSDDGATARVGITDYAQSALGDVVFVQLPRTGDTVRAGLACGEIESTKTVSDLYAPLSGVVVAVNTALEGACGLVNSDPYGEGWLIEIQLASEPESAGLLDATAYALATE